MQKAERKNIEALAVLVEELNRYRSYFADSDGESDTESKERSGGEGDDNTSSTLSFQSQIPMSYHAAGTQ